MEKKTSVNFFDRQWAVFLHDLGQTVTMSVPFTISETPRSFFGGTKIRPGYAIAGWFLYFTVIEFFVSFADRYKLGALMIPLYARGCLCIWRNFFAYFGNRGIVGWRRLALLGFFTKLRYVTRYNYKRRTHYFFRREQRRWRLFRLRRRPFFFLKRHKKFRRLRRALSFNLSWRSTKRLLLTRFRWGGSATRVFVHDFLLWKALYLSQANPRLSFRSWRLLTWRRSTYFFTFRHAKKGGVFSLQGVLQEKTRQRRLWRLKGSYILGCRDFFQRSLRRRQLIIGGSHRHRPVSPTRLDRVLKERRRFRKLPTIYIPQSVRNSGRESLRIYRNSIRQSRFFYLMRRPTFYKFRYYLSRRRILTRMRRLRADRRELCPRRKRRWKWRKRSWKMRRYIRRQRLVRRTLRVRRRVLRRRLRRFFRHRRLYRRKLYKKKIVRRLRRRVKRRRKRRRKYQGRWVRSRIYALRRRQRPVAEPAYFRPVTMYQRRQRLDLIKKHQFFILSSVLTKPLRDLTLFRSTLHRGEPFRASRLRILRSFQQVQRSRQLGWNERELPRHRRLKYFKRRCRFGGFGVRRRWLLSLFVKGSRLQYYKEREFPIVLHPISRQSTLQVPAKPKDFFSASFRTRRQAVARTQFFRRLRRFFFRKRYRRRLITPGASLSFSNIFTRQRFDLSFALMIRKRRWLRRRKLGASLLTPVIRKKSLIFRLRQALFARFRRRVVLRRCYVRTRVLTRLLVRSRWWKRKLLGFRRAGLKQRPRRVMERFLYRTGRRRWIFRARFLNSDRAGVRLRLRLFKRSQRCHFSLRKQLMVFVRRRRILRVNFLIRWVFRARVLKKLQERLKAVIAVKNRLFIRKSAFVRRRDRRNAYLARLVRLRKTWPVTAVRVPPVGTVRETRSTLTAVSRYICPRGFGLLKGHFLLTRRYPSVYDFESFNYLFSSSFLYNRFTQQGNLWRSQIIIMSVLRYLRPYSAFHLVRFIERFLVEGFPIYFEMSSLKQSNKEQPFPIPINNAYFRTYMLKAIATRFRARRFTTSFQAALLTELWSWHVDPTLSILHDFLVQHYAVGMDSRFFVHYRWRVKR